MAGSNLVQSLLRGKEIVDAVARAEDGLILKEIFNQVGLKKTTVYNLLRTLCAMGWLERNAEDKYFIGSGLLAAVRAGNGSAILSQAVPSLLELSEQFPDGTFTFAEFSDDGIWCKLRVSPDRPGIIQRRMLQRFMPYVSASGLLFQALLSEEEFSPLLELYPFADYGIEYWKSIKVFEDYLTEVREIGYATSPSFRVLSMAMALPIHCSKPEHHELRYALGTSFKNTAKIEKLEILKHMQIVVKNLSKFA